jgi:hypothetical protein
LTAALACATAAALALGPIGAETASAAGAGQYVGQVTDALRNPTHKLASTNGKAAGDLLFLDRAHAATVFRTCVRREGHHAARAIRVCFTTTSGDANVPTITPLKFKRGRYTVSWTVDGAVVAHWRFSVV